MQRNIGKWRQGRVCGILHKVCLFSDQSFKVIEAEGSAVAPRAGLILNGREKVVAKNGPFSLAFCQIVALMFLHRNV
jgi:hypothetical protein